ncbi:uncharacterized protein [Argopecten irradians]|uniref:uncharacterized protein n=1 Tax=Argopecten irradians TaxID=31199 RepID=UPI0037100ECA
MTDLRNTVHLSDFNITTNPTKVGCIALCTSTPGCSYVTYQNDTYSCLRHQQLFRLHNESNARIWKGICKCFFLTIYLQGAVRYLRPCSEPSFTYNSAIGLCVFYSEFPRTWGNAKLDCEQRGGQLFVANTETKLTGVQTSFSDKKYMWIGGYLRGSDGKLIWFTGELINLDHFQPGEPSGEPANVVAFWNNRGTIKLDDGFAQEIHPYLCELL